MRLAVCAVPGCGCEFYRNTAQSIYCSRACDIKARWMRKNHNPLREYTCQFVDCGVTFFRSADDPNARYCSPACRAAKWTRADDDEVIELRLVKRLTYKACGAAMGRTEYQVTMRLRRLKKSGQLDAFLSLTALAGDRVTQPYGTI